MKTSTSDLRTLLHGSRDAAYADLVTVTLADATVARWTTGDADLVYGGNTYTAGGRSTAPILTLSKIREAIGLEVSTLDLTLGCGSTATMGGVDLRQLAASGSFDDARVSVTRAYSATPGGAVVGAVQRFSGVSTDCEADSNEVRLRVQSDIYRLEELLPRHLIREKCVWAFGDAGCGVTPSSSSLTQRFDSTTTANWATVTVPGLYGLPRGNYVRVTSGANLGESRRVVALTSEWGGSDYTLSAELDFPLPFTLATGDDFVLYEGCDKTYAMCDSDYSNTTRRRGFDFVPPPDSVG